MPVEVSFSSVFTARSARTIYGLTPYEEHVGRYLAARDRERYTQFARHATEPSVTALGLPETQTCNKPEKM